MAPQNNDLTESAAPASWRHRTIDPFGPVVLAVLGGGLSVATWWSWRETAHAGNTLWWAIAAAITLVLCLVLNGRSRHGSTHRLADQEQLRASEARFRAIQDTSIDGFMVLDSVRSDDGAIIDFQWTYANAACERIVGRPIAWFAGKRLLQEMPGNRTAGLYDAYVRVVETGVPWSTQISYLLDGVDVYLRIVAAKVGDGFAVTFADLSAGRLAEERVRDSEQRLNIAMDATRSGVFEWDMEDNSVSWTASHYTVLGLTPNEEPASYALWRRHVHPEDVDWVEQAIQGSAASGERYTAEYRILRADGEVRWIQATGLVVSSSGRPRRMVGAIVDITERHLAARALQESEKRFRTVLDASPLGLVLLKALRDQDGKVIDFAWSFANHTAVRQIGRPAIELLGKPIGELLPQTWQTQGLIRVSLQTMETGQTCSIEVSDGASNPSRVNLNVAAPFEDGVLVWCLDITQQKLAEKAVRASASEFAALANSVPALVWTADGTGAWNYFNDQWATYSGEPLQPAMGAGWLELLHPDDRLATDIAWGTALAEGRAFEREARLRDSEGAHRWFMCRAVPQHGPDGRVSRWFGTCTDIDAAKSTEQLLRQQDMRLREADRRKDEFLATLAHELRNPLAPVRTAAGLLRVAGLDAARSHWAIGVIENQVATMALLLDDLLDVSRITQGKLQLKLESVELRSILETALETVRPAIDKRGHRLVVALPPATVRVNGDALRLAQVFANLLGNAAKYMDAGLELLVETEVRDSKVEIRVRDQGIGLAPESLSEIFRMFSQVESARHRADGGMGIGLAMVKGLVELHAGTVEARSAGLGKGSEFIVRLPLAVESVATAAAAPPLMETELARRRVLVADDNRDAADSLAMMLQFDGHEVRVAYDGLQAVAQADALRPEMAFIDIGMPGLSGNQVCQALHTRPWRSEVTLVALTGWGSKDDQREASEAGFDLHLTKPADPQTVRELVERHAGRRRTAEGA